MVTINEHDQDSRRMLRPESSAWSIVRAVLAPVASLKLTVGLLAFSIFLVLAGTLAQAEKDIWEVVGQYFRCWVAKIDLGIFFPKAWFPKFREHWFFQTVLSNASIPFPGGFTIGGLMSLNLLAAHTVRFTVQTRGFRAVAGLVTLIASLGLTWFVIASNDNTNGLQGVPLVRWETLWLLLKIGLAAVCAGGYWLFLSLDPRRVAERMLVLGVTVVLTVIDLALFIRSDFSLGDSSMRILWQLIQGGMAGLALLAACALLFRKRAGIVLLHGGIALMMANELIVALKHEEAQMTLREGETINYVEDIRAAELAVIDRSDPKQDRVVAIPADRLTQPGRIRHPDLPFDVEVVQYFKNATLRPVAGTDKNPATKGVGRTQMIEELRAGTGTDTDGAVDQPAAYIAFFEKNAEKPLGTHAIAMKRSRRGLVGMSVVPPSPERVRVDQKTYEVFLRFKRIYKPYSVTLVDVRSDKYLGTETTRNFSSDILVSDPTRGVENRPIRIWMNNPLRFAGETFYQSRVDVEPHGGKFVEITGLQVVRNTGWMVPYVACMIVAVGMLAQFLITLSRFLGRRNTVEVPVTDSAPPAESAGSPQKARRHKGDQLPTPELVASSPWKMVEVLFPAALVTLIATFLATQLQTPGRTKDGFRLYEFGQTPVVFQGRVKPLDTIARNTLRVLSNRETFHDRQGNEQPAMRWLADLMAETEAYEKHRVVRIDNPEVLETLKLKPRRGFLYSLEEVRPNVEEFNRQVDKARELPTEQLSAYQRKLIEVDRRFRSITLLEFSLREPRLPHFPTHEDMQQDREAAGQQIRFFMTRLTQFRQQAPQALQKMQAPLAIPQDEKNEQGETIWLPFSVAYAEAILPAIVEGKAAPEPVRLWAELHSAFRNDKPDDFNRAVSQYRKYLAANKPTQVNLTRSDFEAFFNNALPFYWGGVCYVLAFVLAVSSWLGWRTPLNRAAFWLIAFTLCIHTAGLIARMYISGRPPVTNLYSSAVFISWGCVVLGLILEWLFGQSIGNIVASVTGFAGLVIGHLLSADGDTFTVLQAVLDTQFWLATHVVCISLGYSTTFLAGFLGILYVATCIVRPAIARFFLGKRVDVQEQTALRTKLGKMIYGVLCFAIFFSFVGTVLGGLWADDSWGRFWGWDPKENGALIIVLWNALVLHARWDKMIGDRGLAVLSLGGNICTSWSWFGVNELGVGLHSYGFTEGVLLALGVTVLVHLGLIATGMLPKSLWAGDRAAAAGV